MTLKRGEKPAPQPEQLHGAPVNALSEATQEGNVRSISTPLWNESLVLRATELGTTSQFFLHLPLLSPHLQGNRTGCLAWIWPWGDKLWILEIWRAREKIAPSSPGRMFYVISEIKTIPIFSSVLSTYSLFKCEVVSEQKNPRERRQSKEPGSLPTRWDTGLDQRLSDEDIHCFSHFLHWFLTAPCTQRHLIFFPSFNAAVCS